MRKSLITLVTTLSGLLIFLGVAAARHHDHGPWPTPTGSAIPTAVPTPGFSNANFNGTYVDFFQGTEDGVGVLTTDGNGNIVSGSEIVSDGTNICNYSLSGGYSVNLDGTGTLTLAFATDTMIAGSCPSSPVTYHYALVMTSDRYINTVSTDAGLLVRGHLTRQHRDDVIGE